MGLFWRRRLVEKAADDRFAVRLDATEREVLAEVCTELADALEPSADVEVAPAFRRLFPVAHAEDRELDAQYQALVHDELRAARVAGLRAVAEGAQARELDRDALEQWMRSVNAVRLVFGTALDVDEEQLERLDPDGPDAPALAVYHFLGQVLDDAVHALSGR